MGSLLLKRYAFTSTKWKSNIIYYISSFYEPCIQSLQLSLSIDVKQVHNRLVHASGRSSLRKDWKQYHRGRKQELNRIYKVPWGLPMSLLVSFVTFPCYLCIVLFLCKYRVLAVLLSTNRNLDLWREYRGGFHIQSTWSFRNTTETKKSASRRDLKTGFSSRMLASRT